jgi:serine/threonine-protein kinase
VVARALSDEAVTVAGNEVTRPEQVRSQRASGPLVAGARYEIGATIGSGGMGEVCSAYDLQIGREVAIKRLHADLPTEPQLARFLREARIQGRLQHPAIPPVHELAADERGRPYFVMKKLAGVTLSEVLRDPAGYPVFNRSRLMRAFVEVCHAIELAHDHGIVHRDLKPSNVLLGDRGEVYVIDWGIAREMDRDEDERGLTLGTPGYMSPEQTRGDHVVDPRADIYALGCLLFEILTGHPLATEQPYADLPPELEPVCRAATAHDRDHRLHSVRLLSDAVQRYLDGDRDLAQRRALAARHLVTAQAAIASPRDDEQRRKTAMREAGRALALDPTLLEAAALVGRLVIEPPTTTPRAVSEELAQHDLATDRHHLRHVIGLNAVSLLVITPLMVLFGVRDVAYLTTWAAVGVACIGCQVGAFHSVRFMRLGGPLSAVLGLAMVGILARMFTPFLIAPGFAAVSLMSFGLSSQARERRVIVWSAVFSVGPVLAVWLAEPIGWLSPTIWTEGDRLILHSPVEGMPEFPVIPALCAYVVFLIATAASIAHAVSSNQHRARVQLQTQAWQLRQLL